MWVFACFVITFACQFAMGRHGILLSEPKRNLQLRINVGHHIDSANPVRVFVLVLY